MQDIVAVSATPEILRIQRLFRRCSAVPPLCAGAILAPARKLATRICGAALLITAAFYAASTDVRAQAGSQGNSQIDAQVSSQIERDAKVSSGHEVRVGIYSSIRSDCSSGPLPSIRLAVSPEHGAVTVKRAMLKATNLKQCLAVEAMALVAFYRAAEDFDGVDRFELEIGFSDGRKQLQHFNVSVSKAAADGQGI